MRVFFRTIKNVVTNNKLLFVILIVAGLLRFVGTNPGYNQFHADEGISYSAAVSMIKNGNLDPLRYDYPALVPLINFVFFKFFFIPVSWIKYYATHIIEIIDGTVHIPIAPLEAKKLFQVFVLGERNLNALIWGRYVTALFSFGNVVLIYLFAKKIFNKNVGLIAALLLTFNYKHVINSHIGLPDLYNAFFVLLMLNICFTIWKNAPRKNYLLAGLALGLSFSTKYQVFAVFPLLLSHFFTSVKDNKIVFKKLFSLNIFLAFIAAGLVVFLVNPYHILSLDNTMEIVRGVSLKYAMGVKKINLYPLSYFYRIDYGPIEFFTVFVGILVTVLKQLKKALLVLAYLIPFCFVFLYYSNGGFYVRNFITITPLLFVFAAYGLWEIYRILEGKLPRFLLRPLSLAFLIILLFIPARNAIISSISYTKPRGYDLMRPWVLENLPKDVIVATHPFDAANLKVKNKTTEFEIAGAYSIAEHKENGASYAIFDLNWAGTPFYYWMSFGFDKFDRYWNKPLNEMRNTFHGIAAEEYFRYQRHSVSKPWQAPDTHIIIAKFPEWNESGLSEIQKFDFEKDNMGWVTNFKKASDGPNFLFDANDGYKSKGSIVFIPGGSDTTSIRTISKPTPVKEGHLYKVEGFLKTQSILAAREREGFIRIDFYDHKPIVTDDLNKQEVALLSSVSARVHGTDDWTKKYVIDQAPKGAKFLTISFQTYITTKTKIWLDDVNLLESHQKVENISDKPEYNIQPMDLNYIYPNSHGNL